MKAVAAAAATLAAAIFALAAAPAGACACGIAFEASVVEERAILIETPYRQEIIAEFDLRSAGSGPAAVVFPVPGKPRVAAVEGDPIGYLDSVTSPAPVVGSSEDGSDGAAAPTGSGVDVIGRDVIGGYDVTRLRAGDPKALERFLDANGYRLPDRAGPILRRYVSEDWNFVAVKLAEKVDGRLKPLRIWFPIGASGGDLIYPMRLTRLGSEPVTLTLYVIAEGPREIEGLERVFEAPVSALSPSPDEELASLVPDGSHISRLTANAVDPSEFTTDLTAVPSPTSGHSFLGGLLHLLSLIF